MRHRVFLGIGSNIGPRHHVTCALDELAASFDVRQVSSVYESASIGFEGAPFLNCVVSITTTRTLPSLASRLRQIEFRYGRPVHCRKFSSRSLDIDILTYDNLCGRHHGIVLPREETTQNAYVLRPFSEIAGSLLLPGTKKTLSELWSGYDSARQPLTRVPFTWHGHTLPLDFAMTPGTSVATADSGFF